MSQRFGRHVAATFVAYMAGLAANLVVSILVARLLGPEKAGRIVMAMVGPNVLALLGTLGLPAAVSHFLSRRPGDARRIVAAALAVALGCGLVLAGAYLAALPLVVGAIGIELRLAALAAAVIPLEILIQTTMAVCQGRQAFNRRMAILLAYRWLYAAGAAVLVAAWSRQPETIVAASVAAYLLADLAALVIVARLVFRGDGCHTSERRPVPSEAEGRGRRQSVQSEASASHSGPGSAGPPECGTPEMIRGGDRDGEQEQGGLLRALLAYGWRAHVSAVLLVLVLRADVYLVRYLTGDTAQVGFYSRGVQVAEVVLYFLLAVENVLFPRMSSLPPAEIPGAAAALCRRGLLAGLLLVAAFEAASRWLIVVPFGQEFAPSIAPLRILLPGVLAVGFARMLFAVFYAQERPWAPAVVAAAALVIVTALDLVMIPRWGINGAAAASLIGYGLACAATLGWFALRNKCCPCEFLIPRRDDLAALGSVLRK